jgi:hypothetical protein
MRVSEVEEGEGGTTAFEATNGHCRSHNIAAGCCVASEASASVEGWRVGEYSRVDVAGVGKGMRSIWMSSPSCLKRVGVRVGDSVMAGGGEVALLEMGVVLREPRTSADS